MFNTRKEVGKKYVGNETSGGRIQQKQWDDVVAVGGMLLLVTMMIHTIYI